MEKKALLSCLAVVLIALTGVAQAQCENMRVIVRNSVYPVLGLDAFCTDFNKMKADVANMRSELSIARQENVLLKARLAATSEPLDDKSLAHESALHSLAPLSSSPDACSWCARNPQM